jgi:hypothetical protein
VTVSNKIGRDETGNEETGNEGTINKSLEMRIQEANRKTRNEYKGHKERCSEEPGRDGTGKEKEEAIR